jgi:glycosyltransferase involved in cell wall biosynthesis
MTSLSVLVPVYNEQYLVATSLTRLKILETSPHLERIEVIVVDDCSKDDTPQVLERFKSSLPEGGKISWIFLKHEKNGGKGKAIQTALERATCELTVIHDADLEYHPKDLLRIVKVFVEEEADAVFGSRFAGGESRRVLFYRHELGNKLLTFLCNVATNLNLTDMETCYKAVRTPLFKSIPILSNDFRLEPELTIKLAKRDARIFEVPISYSGRTYAEGKKINWRDGFKALWAIAKFAISDSVYRKDEFGSHVLHRISRAPKFNSWLADTVRPYCGNSVLEIGSGVGELTTKLIPRRKYVASDINPLYVQTLSRLRADRPYLTTTFCDVNDVATFPKEEGPFDTVIALNVIEHVEDDKASLNNLRSVLAPDGKAIVLVPQGQSNFGTLDEVLGHKRRYSESQLRALADECGFTVKAMVPFNRFGTPAWWFNGRLMRRRTFGKWQIALLNKLMPIIRRIDNALPFAPLSLIAVLEKKP